MIILKTNFFMLIFISFSQQTYFYCNEKAGEDLDTKYA